MERTGARTRRQGVYCVVGLKLVRFIPVCLIASTALSGQTPSCIPNLDGLKYPAAAFAARIQGTVNMIFTVDADGKATDLDSNAYPLLRLGVEQELRSATMAPACSGQRVSIRVFFELSNDIPPNSGTWVQRVSETVWKVVTSFPTIETTIYDPYDPPSWALTRTGRFLHRVGRWFSKL